MRRQALLPLVTYPDAPGDAIIANAVAMARTLDTDLTALALNADIPPVGNAISRFLLNVPEMIMEAEAQSRKRGGDLLDALRRRAAAEGVPAYTEATAAEPALLGEMAAVRARYFDIAFVGWDSASSTSALTAEAVVFGSGRPTLLLPDLWEAGPLDHVAIAWDGTRVAARAVADALPLFERAAKISVLTVTDEKPLRDEDAAEKLAAGLRQRGLAAAAISIRTEDCAIATTLQEHAIGHGAKALVMGGYGHSRLREFVLGGATEGVLSDLRLPVMLSH